MPATVSLRRRPTGQRVGQVDRSALVRPRTDALPFRRPGALQGVPHLPVRDHIGRRHDLEAGDARHRRLLQVLRGQRVLALSRKRAGDAVQHLHQVGAGAAAGIQNPHRRIGQAVRDAEFAASAPGPPARPYSGRSRAACTRPPVTSAVRDRRRPGTARRSNGQHPPLRNGRRRHRGPPG